MKKLLFALFCVFYFAGQSYSDEMISVVLDEPKGVLFGVRILLTEQYMLEYENNYIVLNGVTDIVPFYPNQLNHLPLLLTKYKFFKKRRQIRDYQ